ncbi:Hsp20/alpha crystallin family protein [Rickettsiella massiliensis]|uniref:Hsp20/alpha crystallin family protein n=1 Tax=Rickettsiella massiliensis TaxID=676517 RepID=UPI00029A6A47|nr:Hsp20/alpha crystallin family protein [Rickettsiella massiliensis]
MEYLQGCFYRRFSLPDTAEAEKVTAQGNQGVLEIIIPKRQKPKTKKVKIVAKKQRTRA